MDVVAAGFKELASEIRETVQDYRSKRNSRTVIDNEQQLMKTSSGGSELKKEDQEEEAEEEERTSITIHNMEDAPPVERTAVAQPEVVTLLPVSALRISDDNGEPLLPQQQQQQPHEQKNILTSSDPQPLPSSSTLFQIDDGDEDTFVV
jgi:hypothetical protein